MDVVELLDGMKDLLGCVVLRWSTYYDVKYTNMQVLLSRKEPPKSWYDIVDFQNITSVVQVVRKKYGTPDDSRRVHWATRRSFLNRFVKLGSAAQEERKDAPEFDYSLLLQFCFPGTP